MKVLSDISDFFADVSDLRLKFDRENLSALIGNFALHPHLANFICDNCRSNYVSFRERYVRLNQHVLAQIEQIF